MNNEVTIGNQVWMSENLNVDKFRNGDAIPEVKTDEEWEKAAEKKQPAWCYYNNDPANGAKYGKLYNWYAVNDPRGLAPEGWKVPSDEDWSILTDYLSEESGFSGLPGGTRDSDGTFGSIVYNGFWWSSTEDDTIYAWGRYLFYDDGDVIRYSFSKVNGFSVRCLRD